MNEPVTWGMRAPFARHMIGHAERRAVDEVLRQQRLTEGPKTVEFEEGFRDFCGGGAAVAVSSCTAALHLCWLALGIGRDDVIAMPALTHAATAHAIEATGAAIALVDSLPDGNIDPAGMPECSGACVVHFLGSPAPVAAIADIVRPVVEDCALALGTTVADRHVGLVGDAGAFSFYPAKHITTGEGGMVLTTSNDLFARVRKMRAFGKHVENRDFDVLSFGLNYRMSEIAAAIGVEQLKRLEFILRIRRRNAMMLLEALHPNAIGGDYAVSYIASTSDAAREIRGKLKSKSIEASVYYPKPIHRLSYFQKRYGWQKGDFPVAESICERSITLSVAPHISDRHREEMIATIKEMDG